jgi:hypothetical protein
MIFSKNPGTDGRGWRRLLILVAICSLTLSVATRFSLSIRAQGHAVKSMDSRSGVPKQQRLDRDTSRFAVPVANFTPLRPLVFHSSVIPPEPSRSLDIPSPVLSNRPPPLSSVLFF